MKLKKMYMWFNPRIWKFVDIRKWRKTRLFSPISNEGRFSKTTLQSILLFRSSVFGVNPPLDCRLVAWKLINLINTAHVMQRGSHTSREQILINNYTKKTKIKVKCCQQIENSLYLFIVSAVKLVAKLRSVSENRIRFSNSFWRLSHSKPLLLPNCALHSKRLFWTCFSCFKGGIQLIFKQWTAWHVRVFLSFQISMLNDSYSEDICYWSATNVLAVDYIRSDCEFLAKSLFSNKIKDKLLDANHSILLSRIWGKCKFWMENVISMLKWFSFLKVYYPLTQSKFVIHFPCEFNFLHAFWSTWLHFSNPKSQSTA